MALTRGMLAMGEPMPLYKPRTCHRSTHTARHDTTRHDTRRTTRKVVRKVKRKATIKEESVGRTFVDEHDDGDGHVLAVGTLVGHLGPEVGHPRLRLLQRCAANTQHNATHACECGGNDEAS